MKRLLSVCTNTFTVQDLGGRGEWILIVFLYILTKPGGLLLGHEHPQGVVVVVVAVEELGQAHAHVGQHGPVGGRGEDAEGSRQQLHRGHG